MVSGTVNAWLEAVLRLRLRGPSGAEADIDAIVDTGSAAALTLPVTTVATLGLPKQSDGRAVLADGSVRQFDIYAVEVYWDGRWRPVLAAAVGRDPLVGMRLLAGHELRVRVVAGGSVKIAVAP